MNRFKTQLNSTYVRFHEMTTLPARFSYLFLILILAGTLGVRMTTIGTPSLKWTAWKEMDYLTISQNYMRNGFNFLVPEVSWPAEPPRVTEMELPLVPFATAILYKLFGYTALTARASTLVAFLLLIIYVFKLGKREAGSYIGLLAGLAVGIIPLYHPFGRLLFTEPVMIAASVMSIYYTAEWVEYQSNRERLLALVVLSLTFSLKLESLYLLLPLSWIAFRKFRWNFKLYGEFVVLIFCALIVPVIWYSYAYYLENTGAHLFGIFKGHNKSQILTMLTNLQWYRTMVGRVINEILGGSVGSILFILGTVNAIYFRKGGLFFAYLISIGAYFALVAEGQIDAPYRQLPLIPSASLFVALGVELAVIVLISVFQMFSRVILTNKSFLVISLTCSFLFILLIPYKQLHHIFPTDAPVHWDRWQLAQEAKKYTDLNSKLVVVGEYTSHVGGFDLSPVIFYYSDLQGWVLTPDHWTIDYVENLRKKGATHFVVSPPYQAGFNNLSIPSYISFVGKMKLLYPTLYEYQDQLILDLR